MRYKALAFVLDFFSALHFIQVILKLFVEERIFVSNNLAGDALKIEEEFLNLHEEVVKAVESVASVEATEIANQTDAPTKGG